MRRAFGLVSAVVLLGGVFSSAALAGVSYLTLPTPWSAVQNARHTDNCVLFLRNDLKIKLPTGLTSWSAKRRLINVTGTPRYGDVAIIEVPTGAAREYGHVAMVYSVSSTSITIVEANFRAGRVTMRRATGRDRTDAASQMNIRGYFRPS